MPLDVIEFDDAFSRQMYIQRVNRVVIPAMVGDEIEWHIQSWDLFFLVPHIFGLQLLEIPTSLSLHWCTVGEAIFLPFLSQYTLQPQDHTGENIKEALSATLLQWNLDQSKQVEITTNSVLLASFWTGGYWVALVTSCSLEGTEWWPCPMSVAFVQEHCSCILQLEKNSVTLELPKNRKDSTPEDGCCHRMGIIHPMKWWND